MSIIGDIKTQVKKTASNKGKILYFRSDSKVRVRFLEDMEEGHKYAFHDSFEKGINVLCQEALDKECLYCENEELRTRDMYCWSVWDYDAKEVKLMLFAVNNCSPIPAIVALYDAYGTITDRDYVITRTGKSQSTSYSAVPMDKVRFRNEKAKPFSEAKILSILDKAFPADDSEDEDKDEKPARKSAKSAPPTHIKKRQPDVDDEDEDEDEDEAPVKNKKPQSAKNKPESKYADEDEDDEDEEEADYSELSALELYRECKRRKIDADTKKQEKYYIRLLQENDRVQEDWGDDDEEDEDE